MAELVGYELRAGVARITMNDGKVNVMSLAMLTALSDAFDRAARDEAIAVFRSGRPGIFSAGFDLKVFAAGDAAGSLAMVKAGAELALKLLSSRTPIISIVEGHAYPMGAFLTLASDIRIAAEGPHRIGFNEVAIGIPVPSFALELGRQRLLPAFLNRSAVTGEMFGVADALAAGFYDRVAPAGELETAVDAAIQTFKQAHWPSHGITKKRLRKRAIAAVRAAIDAELTIEEYQASSSRTEVRLPKAS